MKTFRSATTLLLAACSVLVGTARAEPSADMNDVRWYSTEDVKLGEQIFAANCAACHGARAQGETVGSLRVPPLNGSGHSAHHGLDDLLEHVTSGGARKGGKMPAFGAILSESERRAAIAWVQSLWPDEAYRSWQQMYRRSQH